MAWPGDHETLLEVLRATNSITDWSSLSMLMGLQTFHYKSIQKNAENPKLEIIQAWLDMGKASWASLATYLCDELVNKVALAKEIAANHKKMG